MWAALARADRCVLTTDNSGVSGQAHRVCDDRGLGSHRFWCQASRVIISGFAPDSQRLISDCVPRHLLLLQ